MLYINYNNEDGSSVSYLVQKLRQQDFDVWIDKEQMISGDLVLEKIDEGLNKSSEILVCVGRNGLSKAQKIITNIIYEIFNEGKGKKIIVILLPGGDKNDISSFLRTFPIVDFINSIENNESIKQLISILRGENISAKIKNINEQKYSIEKPKNRRVVSVALIFENKILALQRANTQKSGTGLWQLPGGKVNENESNEEAAIREISEEVGISINKIQLEYITDLVDTWIINNSNDYITMSLFLVKLETNKSIVGKEFQNHKWIKLSEILLDDKIIFFGSTDRYLRIIRRFIFVYIPLKELSSCLENHDKLPINLNSFSEETTQAIYSFLSLLGFLDDKKTFSASSTLSGKLTRILSEWALTESVIFEANSEKDWKSEFDKKGDTEEVERYRSGLFDHHQSLIGSLSHRISKAISTRYVCDIIITAVDVETQKKYLLIRWDFLANKFQIPSKGLEDLNLDIQSTASAEYVVKERLDEKLVNKFEYKYYDNFKTSHVGAGSLGDGPILRNYIIAVFDLIPKINFNDQILDSINNINIETITEIDKIEKLEGEILRHLKFYVWVDIDYLNRKRIILEGRKLQGFNEIITEFGQAIFDSETPTIILNDSNNIPVIGSPTTKNPSQLEILYSKHLQ